MADVSDGPISDRLLDRLRTTAALVAAVPNLAAKLCLDDRVLLEIRRPPFPDDVDHDVMPVCVFHHAVSTAFERCRAGEQIAMRGVGAGTEPSIEWGISGPGWILPGGIIRLERGDRWWHVAALPINDPRALAHAKVPDVDVGVHADDDIGVAVLHATVAAGDDTESGAVVDRLIGAIAHLGVADLERRLHDRSVPDTTVGPVRPARPIESRTNTPGANTSSRNGPSRNESGGPGAA